MRISRVSWFAFALVTSALAIGCEETAPPPATSAPAKTATATAKPTAKPTATASAVATAEAAVELVEKDLSTAGAAFKGWVAKGPADATVMEDLGGARIATKKVSGPGSFDLAFKMGKQDLKKRKADLEKGAATAKSKITFTTDTAEALVWTTEIGTTKSYDFIVVQKSSDKDVTCYTVTSRDSEADLKALQDACKTLEKKDGAAKADATAKPDATAKTAAPPATAAKIATPPGK